MKTYRERDKAKLPFDTMDGHQEYIELATIDYFRELGYTLTELASNDTSGHYPKREFCFAHHISIDDTTSIRVAPTISRVWIESEEYLIDKQERVGAVRFAHVIMNTFDYIKVFFNSKGDKMYMKIFVNFCYPATKDGIDEFVDTLCLSGIIMQIKAALTVFYKKRHLFSTMSLSERVDTADLISKFEVYRFI